MQQNPKRYKQSQELHNEDAKLKQDREAFQRQLEEKWGDNNLNELHLYFAFISFNNGIYRINKKEKT